VPRPHSADPAGQAAAIQLRAAITTKCLELAVKNNTTAVVLRAWLPLQTTFVVASTSTCLLHTTAEAEIASQVISAMALATSKVIY
jgi:hypothetical protein